MIVLKGEVDDSESVSAGVSDGLVKGLETFFVFHSELVFEVNVKRCEESHLFSFFVGNTFRVNAFSPGVGPSSSALSLINVECELFRFHSGG